jgi:hypothetical protein
VGGATVHGLVSVIRELTCGLSLWLDLRVRAHLFSGVAVAPALPSVKHPIPSEVNFATRDRLPVGRWLRALKQRTAAAAPPARKAWDEAHNNHRTRIDLL